MIANNVLSKFNSSHKVFFTSDTHFGHNKEFIYKHRGYSNIDEHDTNIINEINNVVGQNDYLFHLGDFCLNTDLDKFNSLLDRINCQNIYKIWGNHSNCHKKKVYRVEVDKILPNSKAQIYPIRYRNIVYLGTSKCISIGPQLIIMNHFPLLVFDQSKNGAWHLHGHCHGNLGRSLPDAQDGKVLDVGWDVFRKPVSFEEVSRIMDKKVIKSEDGRH